MSLHRLGADPCVKTGGRYTVINRNAGSKPLDLWIADKELEDYWGDGFRNAGFVAKRLARDTDGY